MNIPEIETERLLLVAPDLDCWQAYLDFYTDAEASKMYSGPFDKGKTWARLNEDVGAWHLSGYGVWAIKLKESGKIVGTCGFWQGIGWPRELTWWLLPEYRGKGLAREASVAAIEYAYQGFGWDIVETCMNDQNDAARYLTERLGGVKDRRMTMPDGLTRDVYRLPCQQ